MLPRGWEIEDNLREFGDNFGEGIEGIIGSGFSNHEASKHAVASSFAWENDVAGLFPADFNAVGAHGFGDIGVANGGDFGLNVVLGGPVDDALVGHDGDCDFVEIQEVCEDGDNFVAVNGVPFVVNEEAAVAVAVVSHTKV